MAEEYYARPERRPTGGIIAGLIALLVLIGGGVWVYRNTRPEPVQAARRDIVGGVSVPGTVIVPPSAQATVLPPWRAPVDKVESSVGSHVSRGDVLVKLAMPSVQTAVDSAKANLQAAETAYANARRSYDASSRSAQQQLDAARNAEQNAANPPPGTANLPQTPSDATANRVAAEQAAAAARYDRDSSLAPYLQQVEAARAAYNDAKAGAKVSLIRSPIGGTVLQLNATPGAEVGVDAKQPVAYIVDLHKLQVGAELTPEQASGVKQGMTVVLAFAELPGQQFEGKVSQITTTTDQKLGGLVKQQKYMALIDFKNEKSQVRPGMKPMVTFKTGEARNALAVPADAVKRDSNGRPIVEALRGGKWQQVVVTPGVSDGHYTEIRSGLNDGETVKVTPNLVSAATR